MQKLCVIFKKAVSLPLVIITSNLLSHRASLSISCSDGRVGDESINLITEINRNMKTLANIVWLLCGGLEAAFGYFSGSLALAITIIGIPFAMQTFKIGLLCLWPFGARVIPTASPTGCLRVFMNFIWFMCGGVFAWLMHAFFGLFFCITIIGIPWGKQHFKMAGLALAPFGKDVELDY